MSSIKDEILALETTVHVNRFKIVTKGSADGSVLVTLKDADGNTFEGRTKTSGYVFALRMAVARMRTWAERLA